MRSIYLFILLATGISLSQAQIVETPEKQAPATLPVIKASFEAWLDAQSAPDYPDDHVENELDGLQTHFMRWYYLMQTRVDAEGNLPNPNMAAREWAKYKELHPGESSTRAAGWEAVGTADVPSNGGGAGRINVVVLHPDNPNIIFIGSAGGGIWKSPDAGSTWIPLSDHIPVTSIADIAIDPIDPDIMYIATGDGYGYEATWQTDYDFWGGVYSNGVMKTTDGGLTWMPTGLSYLQEDLVIVQKLLIYPENTNILLAATREGILRSTDGGDTWTEVESTHCYDLAIHKTDADIMYAVGNRDVLVSEDAGATWTILKDNLGAAGDRMSIETTADNPDLLYVLSGNWSTNFYKSTNGGVSWSTVTSPASKTSFYGYYDNAFAVSDVNSDLIVAGGLEIARTTNGASSWLKKSNWSDVDEDNYVHADNHAFAHHPTDDNIIYSGNDGGLFRSDDQGETWTDLSDGLRIAQIYRIGTSATDPEMVLGGWQDNGTNLWDGTSWEEVDVSTWDGMEAIIDFTDSDIMFLCHQYGSVYKTTNGGATWNSMSASGGGWVTPYVMDPNDHQTLYYGANGALYRTTNGGTSWVYKNASLGTQVFAIAVAPSNSNFVYAASLNSIKRSEDKGDSWSAITTGLPVGDIGINYIAVNNTDEQKVYVALSGYAAGDKVYYSEDGGATWTNISGTLPNVPVNTIVYENDSEHRVYVGTDIGVFYTDDFLDDWIPYQTGLPNVMIHELEINYTSQKLVAATYGRGVWQSDLAESPSINTGVTGDPFCVNQNISVDYTATITFYPGNELTVELSDEAGSFDAASVIGSATSSVAAGSIDCFLPIDLPFSDSYRIRVSSNAPSIVGFDNGADLYIGCAPVSDLSVSDLSDVSVVLNWEAIECAESYNIRYRESGGAWIETSSSVNSLTLTGLLSMTEYEWSVQTVCTSAPIMVASDYTDDASFITLDIQASIQTSEQPFGLQVYLDPVHNLATLFFTLNSTATVFVQVFDVRGREVQSLDAGILSGGAQNVGLKTEQLTSGLYIVRLTVGKESANVQLLIE